MNYAFVFCDRIARVINSALRSIWHELPLFVTILLLWGSETFREWNGVLCLREHPHFIDYFGRICILFLWAFLIVLLPQRLRMKAVVRSICYSFVVGLFLLGFFLRKTTGMDITPSALQLLIETDARETSDFLNTYVYNSDGVLLLVLILLSILLITGIEFYWSKVRRHPRESF